MLLNSSSSNSSSSSSGSSIVCSSTFILYNISMPMFAVNISCSLLTVSYCIFVEGGMGGVEPCSILSFFPHAVYQYFYVVSADTVVIEQQVS